MHLYLAPLPLHTGPSMLLATTPESAISALESGAVTRLSVSEEWKSCDPKNRVAKYYENAIRSGKALPEWQFESIGTLLRSPAAIAKQVLDRCSRPEYGKRRETGLSKLSAHWRFENFTPSPGDDDALAFATLASLENRKERTPLIFFGPRGSGKSHLLHSIGYAWSWFHTSSGRKLLVMNAGEFMADCAMGERISALRRGDCLLFDDLEALKDSDLIHLSNLVTRLIGQEIGMIFCWRGERKGIANFACSHFAGFPDLCIVALHGR